MSDSLAFLNVIRDRMAAWLGHTHGGARDLYTQFGWFPVLVREQMFAMYQRNAMANRIVRIFPQSTWREKPVIRDEAGSSPEKGKPDYSAFVEAVDLLFERYRMYHFLERGDRVSSIGQFGCLLLGFNDGQPTHLPLSRGKWPLLYIQPYSELNITVGQMDDDPRSTRFGRPTMYTLQTGGTIAQGLTTQRRSITAHWTRVIHIAETPDENDIYGIPRLFPIYNSLQDLEKTLGATAETFWLNARAGLSLEADKDAQMGAGQLEAARAQAIEYEHQLRRVFALQGMKANQLNAEVADPQWTLSGLMDNIAGGCGVPKRILLGSERGELASSQDENNWAQRTQERRESFAVPSILRPLISLLLYTGNLPEPEGQWWVEWEGQAMTPEQQSTVGLNRSNILRNYLGSPGADIVVPIPEFRASFLGLPPTPSVDYEMDPFADLREDEEPAQLEAEKPDEETEAAEGEDQRLAANVKIAPLYVCRPVLNTKDILDWARKQGFGSTLPAEDLHVTILYSKASVNWNKIGTEDYCEDEQGRVRIKPGGMRLIECYGDAVVLSFSNSAISYRHENLLRMGASSDHEQYCPHITLTYDLGDLDPVEIEPYDGEIILGPERFEELNPNAQLELVEAET